MAQRREFTEEDYNIIFPFFEDVLQKIKQRFGKTGDTFHELRKQFNELNLQQDPPPRFWEFIVDVMYTSKFPLNGGGDVRINLPLPPPEIDRSVEWTEEQKLEAQQFIEEKNELHRLITALRNDPKEITEMFWDGAVFLGSDTIDFRFGPNFYLNNKNVYQLEMLKRTYNCNVILKSSNRLFFGDEEDDEENRDEEECNRNLRRELSDLPNQELIDNLFNEMNLLKIASNKFDEL